MTAADWRELRERAELLQQDISRIRTVNVNSRDVRTEAEALASDYFKVARPFLIAEGVDTSDCGTLDAEVSSLLKLAQGRNQKRSYLKVLGSIRKGLTRLEVARLGALANHQTAPSATPSALTPLEVRIAATLRRILPSAALSYEQACWDLLADRLSYRGTAVDLREALRESARSTSPRWRC